MQLRTAPLALAQPCYNEFLERFASLERLQLRRLLLAQRASTHSVQPVPQCSLRNNAAAPLLQSANRGAPQRPEEKKSTKRDILRRTAMHASHRRELLVPRESQFVAC